MAAYRNVIAAAIGKLKADRFACFVVGDYRDKHGFYRNFPGETIEAFAAAGAGLYNEAILVTAAGSLPIRAGKQFSSSRKLGKTHQNVLIFCKGDPRKATEACGPVEIDEVAVRPGVRGGTLTPPVVTDHFGNPGRQGRSFPRRDEGALCGAPFRRRRRGSLCEPRRGRRANGVGNHRSATGKARNDLCCEAANPARADAHGEGARGEGLPGKPWLPKRCPGPGARLLRGNRGAP